MTIRRDTTTYTVNNDKHVQVEITLQDGEPTYLVMSGHKAVGRITFPLKGSFDGLCAIRNALDSLVETLSENGHDF